MYWCVSTCSVSVVSFAQSIFLILTIIACSLVQPQSTLTPSGTPVSFTSQSSGPVTSSMWQVSKDAGATWVDALSGSGVTGATASGLGTTSLTLNVPGTLGFDGYYFRAVFTNAQGTRVSQVAVLSVFDSTYQCTDYGCNGLSRESVCLTAENCGAGVTGCGCLCTACPSCVGVANPSFSKQCSANIILILDESGSISGYLSAVKAGVTQFLLSFSQTRTVGG
jgi:hypothetical protein